MIRAKIISSLEKCLPDADVAALRSLGKISVLRGERLSLQLVFRESDMTQPHRVWYRPRLTGAFADMAQIRLVDFIPSQMPVYPGISDSNYISKAPGLYPDLLSPLPVEGSVPVCSFQTRCAWITVEIPDDFPGGDYELGAGIYSGDTPLASDTLTVTVIPACLPEQKMKVTQWFHCDCLADYYNVEVFSERHWEIIENFARTAAYNGIDTLLTPVFTPPLDTAIGHERLTVQLVGVTLDDGKYSFDYSKLDRWIEMCNRVGMRFFEISHLFTQWGAAHAPKIIATVNGVEKRIFGWETDASGEEYSAFLHAFIPDFISHMKARGDDTRCIFHISDEPTSKNLEQYEKSRAVVADMLKGYTTMDALSNVEFWQRGFVDSPVASNTHIEPFIAAGVPNLWTYYCCGQSIGVSNRYFAMPGARTRAIGMQFYKFNIAGFLQWGYNFYMNQGSYDRVDPYADSTGGCFFPSGDGYSVYPGHDGNALESMRIVQFFEGLQDRRAMELCEKYYGHDRVVAEMEAVFGEIRFSRCPASSDEMLAIRERINSLIAQAVGTAK